MALILRYNGANEEVDVHSLTLETMQRIVQGYVELVHLGEGRVLLVNEDARAMGLPFNLSATSLAHTTILGDTIFLTKEEAEIWKRM